MTSAARQVIFECTDWDNYHARRPFARTKRNTPDVERMVGRYGVAFVYNETNGLSGEVISLVRHGSEMQITLYLRTYPVVGSPVGVSFAPDPIAQRHTYSAGGREYEPNRQELQVVIPKEARLDLLSRLLGWSDEKERVRSTAKEVYALAEARASGFRVAE